MRSDTDSVEGLPAPFTSAILPLLIAHSIAAGALEALTITASSYQTGMSVSFCMGGPTMELWERSQRIGVRTAIGVPHLLASSAIPVVFPSVEVGGERLVSNREVAVGDDVGDCG